MKNLHLMLRMVTQTLHQFGCSFALPLTMHIAFPSCLVVGLVTECVLFDGCSLAP